MAWSLEISVHVLWFKVWFLSLVSQEIASALALLSDLGYRALIASRSLHRVCLLASHLFDFTSLCSVLGPCPRR